MLMTAHREWARRPADERFTSLTAMREFSASRRQASVAAVRSTRKITVTPVEGDNAALAVISGDERTAPNHWAFGQMCQRVGAPADYLRTLPSPMVADCLNYGFLKRDVEEVGTLVYHPGGDTPDLLAMTGPNYGRIWNETVIDAIMKRFGDGVTGPFTVPGTFGRPLNEVTNANTTLYHGTQDMFVFLADEQNRIEVPNRRNGESGSLARGVIFSNSEVGAGSLYLASFLFDYVCSNRMIWGSTDVQEIRLRHTSGAPDRWLEEVAPAVEAYAQSSTHSITAAIESARAARLSDDRIDDFLRKRFTKSETAAIKQVAIAEEGRPIENVWDAANAATAYARGIQYQDRRVDVERKAGALIAAVA